MSSSSSKAGPSSTQIRSFKRKRKQDMNTFDPATPGVSKIKASLRQTRRLLAKDNLAADVRVETERRLKALEADLQIAEGANKERTLAERYHKHRFFEKRKLTRRIARLQKELVRENLSKKDRKKLEGELYALRVDVNYILHWPKTERYISLFPPEVRQNDGGDAPMPIRLNKGEEPSSETDKKREEVRSWIRECMENGQVSIEPELEHGTQSGDVKAKWTSSVSLANNNDDGEGGGESGGDNEHQVQPLKKHRHSNKSAKLMSLSEKAGQGEGSDKSKHSERRLKPHADDTTLDDDDFFGED